MSFGAVEGMVVLYYYFIFYLSVLAVAVVVSIVFSFLKRRAIVWTPVVALLALPLLLARMASFHDGVGWRFWAEGKLDTSEPLRFWVTIRDQKANPWDRLVQASSGS